MTLPEFLLARIAETDYSARDSTGWASLHILRDCEAKRRIVELHEPVKTDDGPAVCAECVTDWIYPCDTLRWLGTTYADHPDYREEWKP